VAVIGNGYVLNDMFNYLGLVLATSDELLIWRNLLINCIYEMSIEGLAREGQRGVRIACECACHELATPESSAPGRHPLIPPINEVGFNFLISGFF